MDVRAQWPASPEYYNSALIVNGDGDTIANYRKSFLYYTDETWALEGKEGFFRGEIPRVGSTALGICMDLKYVFLGVRIDIETRSSNNCVAHTDSRPSGTTSSLGFMRWSRKLMS